MSKPLKILSSKEDNVLILYRCGRCGEITHDVVKRKKKSCQYCRVKLEVINDENIFSPPEQKELLKLLQQMLQPGGSPPVGNPFIVARWIIKNANLLIARNHETLMPLNASDLLFRTIAEDDREIRLQENIAQTVYDNLINNKK